MDAVVRYRRTPPADMGPMLRAARERADLTVTEAARLAGIGQPHLSLLEAGRRVPSASVAQRLADVLRLDDADRARLLSAAVGDAGRDHPERAV